MGVKNNLNAHVTSFVANLFCSLLIKNSKWLLCYKSTTFLDTTITIKNGKITTDLYRKETDRIQYLLPNSCHPAHICKNVPYSLALRLVRICSEKETLKKRLGELESMLLSRKYNRNIVKEALVKAFVVMILDVNK
jgi:hypothetical protein